MSIYSIEEFSFRAIPNSLQTVDCTAAPIILSPPLQDYKIDKVFMQVEGVDGQIRYTLDGTTPSNSLGYTLFADDGPILIPGLNRNTLTVYGGIVIITWGY
jgi:hypothetical protein